MKFGTPLPEHQQRYSKAERMRLLIQSDPTNLDRQGLIRVLKGAPETVRPPNLTRQPKAALLEAVQSGLKRVAVAYCIAPLIRLEYQALARKKGKTDRA